MTETNNTQLGALNVTGAEAYKLLQGQITCDLDQIADNGSYGAHCNPKGRIISFFYIIKAKDGYTLIMPVDMLAIAKKALDKYAAFYKAKLSIDENHTGDKQLFTLSKGIPCIHPETSECFLPHELNLNELNAVSYNKGCFTGQEIIARMEYRGKAKKKMLLTKVKPTLNAQRGDDLFNAENQNIGSIVDFSNTDGGCLALVLFKNTPETNQFTLNSGSEMTLQEFTQ